MARSTKSFGKVVADDVPTTDEHIPSVIFRATCEKHDSKMGEHCFSFQSPETEKWHFGICNTRAKKAGMNGKIHPSSLDRTYSYNQRNRGQ